MSRASAGRGRSSQRRRVGGVGGEEKEQLPTSVPDGPRGAVANTKRLTKRRPHGLQLRGETGLGG